MARKRDINWGELAERALYNRTQRRMTEAAQAVFTEAAFLDHAGLVVWDKAQLRGIRATLKRLGMG